MRDIKRKREEEGGYIRIHTTIVFYAKILLFFIPELKSLYFYYYNFTLDSSSLMKFQLSISFYMFFCLHIDFLPNKDKFDPLSISISNSWFLNISHKQFGAVCGEKASSTPVARDRDGGSNIHIHSGFNPEDPRWSRNYGHTL